MSFGSETTATGSTAANTASAGSSFGSYMQNIGESTGVGSQVADSMGTSGGFSLGDGSTGTSVGPTVASSGQAGWFDSAMDYLDRFQKGKRQNMPEAWRGRGNNPETYGYLAGKVDDIMGMSGSGGGAAPITTNINYQEPENPYLRRYGRRY